jgi:hypothetical protein
MLKIFKLTTQVTLILAIMQLSSAGPVIEPFKGSQQQFNISNLNYQDPKVLRKLEVKGEEVNLKLRLKNLEKNGSIYDYVLVDENGWPIRPQAAEKPYFEIKIEGEYRLVREKALNKECNAERACLERFDQDINFGEQKSSKDQENNGKGSKTAEPDQPGIIPAYFIIGILAIAFGSLTLLKIAQKRPEEERSKSY